MPINATTTNPSTPNPPIAPTNSDETPDAISGKKKRRKARDVPVDSEAENHSSTTSILASGPFRCTAYQVGNKIDFTPFTTHLQQLTFEAFAGVVHVQVNRRQDFAYDEGPKDAFFFTDGSVVMWNMTVEEEKKWIANLQSWGCIPPVQKLMLEEYKFYLAKNSSSTILSDKIFLSEKVDDRTRAKEQLACSSGLARSLQLEAVEDAMDELLLIFQPVPALYETGKVPKKRIWRRLMSEQLTLRARLNLHSSLLEVPALYWEEPKLESLFQQMERALDIDQRINVLNKKMDYTREVSERVQSEMDTRLGRQLELTIILLIALEVVFHLLEKSVHWREFTWESFLFKSQPKEGNAQNE